MTAAFAAFDSIRMRQGPRLPEAVKHFFLGKHFSPRALIIFFLAENREFR